MNNGALQSNLYLKKKSISDELSLSDDVGAYLSAIVFGSNTTATIIETAGKCSLPQ